MDLLQGNIKKNYSSYLKAAFGSAMISSIYGIVDMAMVGQYQGPDGTAALAVVAPVWNVIYSLGLLTGIGGAIHFSTLAGENKSREGNEFFTVAFLATLAFSIFSWIIIFFFDDQILLFFGADRTLLPLAKEYIWPVKMFIPVFLFNQMLAAFLRNDRNPRLATIAVLGGGLFNVFGDYFFVFTLDMGIKGAGLATTIGANITLAIMLVHFTLKRNTLKLVKVTAAFSRLNKIIVTGFSSFFIDVAMGILTILFNRQIMTYFGGDALAIYGIIVNISTVVQCCAYSVGQAAQPIISINYGAQKWGRINETLKYALQTVTFFGLFWTVLVFFFPTVFIRIFMVPTADILVIAPFIMKSYGLSFLLLPLNIFSTYYFQSIMKPGTSFLISVFRGMLVSGLLIYLLPALIAPEMLWFVMIITELIIALIVIRLIFQSFQTFKREDQTKVFEAAEKLN